MSYINPLNKQYLSSKGQTVSIQQSYTNEFNIHKPWCSRRFLNSKVMYLRIHSAESFKHWSEFARKWTPCSIKENGVWNTPPSKVQLSIKSLSSHLQQKTRYIKEEVQLNKETTICNTNYPHSLHCHKFQFISPYKQGTLQVKICPTTAKSKDSSFAMVYCTKSCSKRFP